MRVRDDVSIDAFRRFELFEGFDADELATMAEFVEHQVYEEGEHIVDEGARSRDMFLLADGRVEVVKSDGDERRFLAMLEPEAVLGELGWVLGEPRSATAVADIETDLLRIAGNPLMQRRGEGALVAHKFGYNVLRSLARRQAEMNSRLLEVMARAEDRRFERDEVTDLRERLAENWSF